MIENQRIKKIRELLGLSQSDFAHRIGLKKRSLATIKSYITCYNHLVSFCEKHPKKFSLINKQWYDNYIGWFRSMNKNENTIGVRVKFIKLIMNESLSAGFHNNISYRSNWFSKPTQEVSSIYLNEEEINKIINLDLEKSTLLCQERYRFVLSYFLLLRHSDSITINKSDIVEINGKYYLKKKAIKTSNEIMLPLKPIVIEILKRYDYSIRQTPNQVSNRSLKEIGKLAGIGKWDQITSHTARRSAATNLYIQSVKTGKPPVKLIMALGGWKTEDSFKKYIRVDSLESAIMAAELDFFR